MAQYNSKYTGAQIEAAVSRALAGGAIDQAIADKKGTTESTDYPGCYYRTVDGVREWLNPPMEWGVEYRTSERYQGQPVYVKALGLGTMPAASTLKSVSFGTGTEVAIDVTGRMEYNSDTYTIPFDRGNGTSAAIFAHNSQVFLISGASSIASYNAYAVVKYIKTTD